MDATAIEMKAVDLRFAAFSKQVNCMKIQVLVLPTAVVSSPILVITIGLFHLLT